MSTFDQMMKVAQTALGTKYVWGGNSLTGGVDCSGFVQQVFGAVGIDLPRVSNLQARAGTAVAADQAQPGDLVWWDLNNRNDGADHIGIYLGNGKVMEASSSRGQVVIRNLWGNAQFSRVAGTPTGNAGAMRTTAGGATGASPAPAVQQQRPQTGLAAMGSLAEGGALALGDLRREGDDDDDPFDIESLYSMADDDDPGEDENTVGPYNVARLMMERFDTGQVRDMGGMERRAFQPTPTPTPRPTARPTANADRFGR